MYVQVPLPVAVPGPAGWVSKNGSSFGTQLGSQASVHVRTCRSPLHARIDIGYEGTWGASLLHTAIKCKMAGPRALVRGARARIAQNRPVR